MQAEMEVTEGKRKVADEAKAAAAAGGASGSAAPANSELILDVTHFIPLNQTWAGSR